MKYYLRTFAAASGLVAIFLVGAGCHPGEEADAGPPVVGSIRPIGPVKPADLPGLAKISFDDARKNALAAVPGDVIAAELEVEDGNLMYSFQIVGADKSITEVEIDAGDGKVLGKEHEDK